MFEGTDYDLLTAMCASCAVPLMMRPVWYGQRDAVSRFVTLIRSVLRQTDEGILVDGGVHHPYAATFCQDQAIIAKLGFAHALPDRLLSPADLVMHLAEMCAAPLLDWYFSDPLGHIVIDIGLPDVACMTFSQPRDKCLADAAARLRRDCTAHRCGNRRGRGSDKVIVSRHVARFAFGLSLIESRSVHLFRCTTSSGNRK